MTRVRLPFRYLISLETELRVTRDLRRYRQVLAVLEVSRGQSVVATARRLAVSARSIEPADLRRPRHQALSGKTDLDGGSN